MSIFLSLLEGLFSLVKVPLLFVLCVALLFGLLVGIHLAIGYIHGRRFKKGAHVRLRKRGVLKRILYDLPKQYADDMFSHNPQDFGYKGLVVFTGRQGYGKTIAMVQAILAMRKEYPLAKTMTNFALKGQDADLKHWKQLIAYKNGKNGVIIGMDELQNWFSSNQSKNFPPEMLEVITQNRKNLRIILGTSQNFYLLAKALRSQCTEVRECITFFGCLTIVHKKEAVLNAEGNVEKWHGRGFYFFVHNKEIRNAYDTYKVIESLARSGFKEDKSVTVNVVS